MSLDVDRLVLVRGSSHPGCGGFSVMEAVAFAAGESWSDRPHCASPALTDWMIAWNDGLDDHGRQELRRYIWRLVGSRGSPVQERRRRWMAADWLVRQYAPGWLAAAGLRDHAVALAGLRSLDDGPEVADAWPVVTAAARAARTARDAAWRAAAEVVPIHDWGMASAVWDAIADVTWGAAGSAARAVLWSASDPAAPGEGGGSVWDAASDAAADAAGALAWGAVGERAAAVVAGWSPGRLIDEELWTLAAETAHATLAPPGSELQASAHAVVDRMLELTE